MFESQLPPSKPCDSYAVKIDGVRIVRVRTDHGETAQVWAVIDTSEGKFTTLRFRLAHHTCTVRKFFRAAGYRQVPRFFTLRWNLEVGSLEGQVIGEDLVPPALMDSIVSALVLEDVTVQG